MKLFRSKANCKEVVVLDHVACFYPYGRGTYSGDDIPSINVTLSGKTTSLLYKNEELRDQDYDDLIKALEKL